MLLLSPIHERLRWNNENPLRVLWELKHYWINELRGPKANNRAIKLPRLPRSRPVVRNSRGHLRLRDCFSYHSKRRKARTTAGVCAQVVKKKRVKLLNTGKRMSCDGVGLRKIPYLHLGRRSQDHHRPLHLVLAHFKTGLFEMWASFRPYLTHENRL